LSSCPFTPAPFTSSFPLSPLYGASLRLPSRFFPYTTLFRSPAGGFAPTAARRAPAAASAPMRPASVLMTGRSRCSGVLSGAGGVGRLGDLGRVGALDEIAGAREFAQLRVESVARGLAAPPPSDPGGEVRRGPGGLLAHDLTGRTGRAGRDAEARDRQGLAAFERGQRLFGHEVVACGGEMDAVFGPHLTDIERTQPPQVDHMAAVPLRDRPQMGVVDADAGADRADERRTELGVEAVAHEHLDAGLAQRDHGTFELPGQGIDIGLRPQAVIASG